jgi:hypothetical protein
VTPPFVYIKEIIEKKEKQERKLKGNERKRKRKRQTKDEAEEIERCGGQPRGTTPCSNRTKAPTTAGS